MRTTLDCTRMEPAKNLQKSGKMVERRMIEELVASLGRGDAPSH